MLELSWPGTGGGSSESYRCYSPMMLLAEAVYLRSLVPPCSMMSQDGYEARLTTLLSKPIDLIVANGPDDPANNADGY